MPSKKFADKYLLALEQAIQEKPSSGLNGFEQEWNLLDQLDLGTEIRSD